MPGMRIFGRRCSLATDDFLLIGVADAILYLPWLGWVPVIYASFLKHRFACDSDHTLLLLDISLPGLCFLFLANWLLAALFIIFSIRGTISNPEPRRHVVTLVYIKLFVSLLDLAWASLGIVILVEDRYCDIFGIEPLVKVCTIWQWLATFTRFVMIAIFYDWNFSKKSKERTEKEYFNHVIRKGTFKKWHLRLQAVCLWCTTPTEARKQALESASELLALLSCDLDLVGSDVIAGLLLYRQKCLVKWKAEKAALVDAPTIMSSDGEALEQFPPEGFQPWMNLQLATRYMNIGLGVFGWHWFIYRHIACGCCLLFRRLTCCFPFRKRYHGVLGDNCCGCSLAGLQATTELPYEDLVHVTFVDKVFEVPFFVTYDHQTSAVIVAVRGTMSMNDCLTDVAANFANMDDPGCPPGTLCHSGMLSAARGIKKKLETKGILDEAFKLKPDYKLVITGHSLGASVSSILTLLMKTNYPEVMCFAFAPAPTLSKAILPQSLKNVFTVIYGNDSVCYLNYENVKNMVMEMVKCLKQCKVPKYKVFTWNERDSEIAVSKDEGDHARNKKQDISNGNGQVKMTDGDNISPTEINADVENGPEVPCVTESVYVAGTILHIWRVGEEYRLKIRTADELKPLLFRPKSIIDHFPQYLQKSLEDLGKTPVQLASEINSSKKEE